MSCIELLAPAGNRECLETAFYFGADAVYAAGRQFGLRAFAANFDNGELKEVIRLSHDMGKRFYVTVNAVLYNREIDELVEYLVFLAAIEADGVIISDPAVLKVIRDNQINIPVHLSTQANTTNYMSAAFWHEMGVKRIVLSRELSLEEIQDIRRQTPETLEIEAFVHGAMCIAHSGRCLLSSAMTGRSGNRGECAQPCRWEYHLSEEGYAGEYFPIEEDDRGTYILNSKDLCMIEHIPAMVRAGITSFKIEGRMKSAYYVASVVNAYRQALDRYMEADDAYQFDEGLKLELEKSATRLFTTGFFFGNPREMGQDVSRETQLRKYTFCAKALGKAKNGSVLVEQRNKFSVGETLEILAPGKGEMEFTVTEIVNEQGEAQDSAPHPQQRVWINCPYMLQPGDLLRRHD